jgi:putative nucleotidyltransferase with HDIG domain
VTAASPTAPLEADGLIELGRARQRRGLASRVSALVGILFVGVAGAALALPAHRHLSLVALGVTLLCYTLAARVKFEFGGVWALPTQPVFVAMWFLLPPRLLPVTLFGALVLARVPDVLAGTYAVRRLPLLAASSWFSVGPAAVIFGFATQAPTWNAVPVYAAALAAQLACDYASSFVCTRAVVSITPPAYFRSVAPAFAVDILLTPLGLLVSFAAYAHTWTLLLVLPVLLMFSTFAKERQARIDNALELSSAYRGTAILLGDVIEADDEYTGSHSRDVVDLALAVADELGLDASERRRAEFAALLHDVGKVKIPAEIINKPGPLDDAEWEVMKTHTILGEEMLETVGGLLGAVGRVVRSCHERWDGDGYPDGLAGEAIPLAARIVCACDAWSAMRTDRTYRKALPLDVAAAELRACAGSQFDPRVVDALATVIGV